jgi:hypothetical protein
MGRKPRRAPQNIPDSLPPRDEGTDVEPDEVRRTDEPGTISPDSPPQSEEEERSAAGGGKGKIDTRREIAKVDSAVRS